MGAVSSFGMSAITQKITTGTVDWGQSFVDGLIGGVIGAFVGWGFLGISSLIATYIFNAWKIEAYKGYFIYRNYLWKKKKYYYTEVELYEKWGTRYYFKKDNKKICSMHIVEMDVTPIIKFYKKANKNRKNT